VRAEEWAQVEELLAAARPLSEDARAALFATVSNPAVHDEVRSLLAADTGAGSAVMAAAIGGAAAAAAELAPGSVIAHFKIVRLLGHGGMGEVYLAEDLALGRRVALKLLPAAFRRDPERVRRFAREARAAAALNHPHIVTVHEVGETDGHSFIATEFVEGETLADALKRGPIVAREAIRLSRHIVGALAAAHAAGVVHRDLKPANVMIRTDGTVKLVDFGLAHLISPSAVTVTRTGAGQVLGTPAYMAPEQQMGRSVDARTDIYAFGCVLHEMLCGTRPSVGRAPLGSRTLERIVDGCLQSDPAHRWQSAADVERLLSKAAARSSYRWRLLSSAVVMAIATATGGWWWQQRTSGMPLTDRDVVVLADFVNSTGDPVFDGALRQGLAIALEQSPFLKTLDDEVVRADIRLMERPAGQPVTAEIAHDVCVREAAAATIGGAISRLGATYVVTLEAVGCQRARTLAREQAQAPDKEHVLQALSAAAAAMRRTLGESLSSIERTNRRLDQFTTSSLVALQTYAAGYTLQSQGEFLSAIPFFRRAAELDPTFAMAQFILAAAYSNAGDTRLSNEYQTNAFRLVDRVSDFERQIISARYYWLVTGELQKAIDAFRLLIATYPRYWGAHSELSFLYRSMGDYERAVEEGREAIRLGPRAEASYRNLASAYIRAGRVTEAKDVLASARERRLEGARLHYRLLEIGYIDNDAATVEREIQWFAGRREEYFSLATQAADADAHGRRLRGRELYARAADSARRANLPNVAMELEEARVLGDAILADCPRQGGVQPALAAALCGNGARAEKIVADSPRRAADGTLWNAVELPAVRAAGAITVHQPSKAIELLATAAPYERAFPEIAYLRGLAHLALGRGTEAAAAFRRIVDDKGTAWDLDYASTGLARPLIYSLAHAGLARGSAMAGDTVVAKQAGDRFLSVWRDADTPVPAILAAPRAALATVARP
jgi:tetratricopeptide (TPR) repeat protein